MARNKFDVDEELESPFSFIQLKRLMVYLKPYKKRSYLLFLSCCLPAGQT